MLARGYRKYQRLADGSRGTGTYLEGVRSGMSEAQLCVGEGFDCVCRAVNILCGGLFGTKRRAFCCSDKPLFRDSNGTIWVVLFALRLYGVKYGLVERFPYASSVFFSAFSQPSADTLVDSECE